MPSLGLVTRINVLTAIRDHDLQGAVEFGKALGDAIRSYPGLQRVAASPGSRDYGLLSVTVQMYGPVEKLFTIPPGAFSPPPKVHSTVFRWRFEPRFAELNVDPLLFLGFVRKAFAQKRKTLANNLRAAGIQPQTIDAALSMAGIDPLARTESLAIETLATLWRSLQKEGATPIAEVAPPVTDSDH